MSIKNKIEQFTGYRTHLHAGADQVLWVSATMAPLYLLAFAVGNRAGPLILGRLYDNVGRKPMISGTYLVSGAMLVVSGYLFDQGVLNAATQTIAWSRRPSARSGRSCSGR
jgi:MFS family permease